MWPLALLKRWVCRLTAPRLSSISMAAFAELPVCASLETLCGPVMLRPCWWWRLKWRRRIMMSMPPMRHRWLLIRYLPMEPQRSCWHLKASGAMKKRVCHWCRKAKAYWALIRHWLLIIAPIACILIAMSAKSSVAILRKAPVRICWRV